MAHPRREVTTKINAAHRSHRLIVPALLLVAAALAVTSFVGDSVTFDEANHLTAGMSFLRTGDFRLTPETPPLARLWASLPLLLVDNNWPPPDTPAWQFGVVWPIGRAFLFELNDGERLIIPARCMMVVVLLATCLCTYLLGRALFGPAVGLSALTLAVLSPTYLAHGRLVTSDMPATLCMAATLLAFALLLRRITWPRLVAVSLSLAAASLVKFSWPLMLPGLGLMAVVAVFRRRPMEYALPRFGRSSREGPVETSAVHLSRSRRVPALVGVFLFVAITTWLSIWTCYGWRYSPFRGEDVGAAMMPSNPALGDPVPTTMAEAWETVLSDENGKEGHGVTANLMRWARDSRLLPEAYLYGMARARKFAQRRPAYLMGEYSMTGWPSYFPIAFGIKTPVATMALLVAGVAAIMFGRSRRCHDPVLLAGVVGVSVVYAAAAVTSHYNVGHRHLLPLYPAVFVFAGASIGWARTRAGRYLLIAGLGWLLIANVRIYPHYLSYFNELIGGPARGHLYLADSNIDWGQDLKRLAAYAGESPAETIKLAYFGSGDPSRYGFDCAALPSFLPFGTSAELTPGVYVVSVTQLVGLFTRELRESFWTAETLDAYRYLEEIAARPAPEDAPAEKLQRRLALARQYHGLRQARLVSRLRHRPPDERIGYSLFVYHLTQADIDLLTSADATTVDR